MIRLRAIDLFCGGGGLSQGLLNAGIELVAALDNWDAALSVYRKNIKGHAVENFDLTRSDLVTSHLRNYDFNMIVGGPPCQDFSSAGKRNEKGARANLTIAFAETICKLLPQYFVMENVERSQKTKTFEKALEIWKQAGYGLTAMLLDASLCGVPQRRKRVIVIGALGKGNNLFVPVIKANQATKPMTIRDYLGNSLGVDYYYRHPRSYARRGVFSIDEPSPTIRGVNRPVPQGYLGHPGDATPISANIRPLTTKERSLLQTFPKEWDVSGTKSEIEQIIGNAVPVKLAEFIGRCIIETLQGDTCASCNLDSSGNLLFFEQRSKYRS